VTVTPLPTNVDTTSPLTDPSHSTLHNDANRGVNDLADRMVHLEQVIAGLTAPQGTIEQARLNASEWVVRGDVVADGALLLPMVWNMTGRSVTFQAAKATLLTPAEDDVEVDIVVGSELAGPEFDDTTQTSVLKAPLVVRAGEAFSVSLGPDDFDGQHPVNSYVAAYVKTVGAGAPGVDLVIQLNRNL
jgi:hypothetical protein